MSISRAEVCVVACAEAFRGVGEVVASPMGTIPRLGALLARATFEPDLLLTDGEAYLVDGEGAVESWLPFRSVFDVVAAGKRHVMMGASQLDRFGNSNISAIGDWRKPTVQLLGARGGPGNTVNHPTSYWIPRHSTRVFVERVDMASGVGYDRARRGGPEAGRFHGLGTVVTNLCMLDFHTRDHSMRLRSVHPGVTVEEVVDSTGFELHVPAEVAETRLPTADELRLLREVLDPSSTRSQDVPT